MSGFMKVVDRNGRSHKVLIEEGKYRNRLVWILHIGPSTWVFRKTDLKLVYVDDIQTGEFNQLTTKEELAYAMDEKGFYRDNYKILLAGLKKYTKTVNGRA